MKFILVLFSYTDYKMENIILQISELICMYPQGYCEHYKEPYSWIIDIVFVTHLYILALFL